MDWPILVDSLNRLEVTAVPITLLIDEHGIIRKIRPKEADLDEFLRTDYPAPGSEKTFAEAAGPPDLEALERRANAEETFAAWHEHANALTEWGGPQALGKAIEAQERAVALEPDHAPARFRLGVAFRRRYDSEARRTGDFAAAVRHWKAALDLDPNQYIWRRRIQQYGPRLDKPYPFYDWVHQARKEIRDRGEVPHPLPVEPSGAEFAAPLRGTDHPGATGAANPDPEGRIHRDEEGFIQLETVAVPATSEQDRAWRVHVTMRPNRNLKAHWNNEAEGVAAWIHVPEWWTVDQRFRRLDNPPKVVSHEARHFEVELRSADGNADSPERVSGYVLYYVCEDVDGVCLFRRQDFQVDLER